MKPHPLTNFEIQDYFKGEPRFNLQETTRNNLPNTDTHWVVLFVKSNEVIYFDSFGVEHMPEEIKKFTGNKNIKSNIFKIQDYNSMMCGCLFRP